MFYANTDVANKVDGYGLEECRTFPNVTCYVQRWFPPVVQCRAIQTYATHCISDVIFREAPAWMQNKCQDVEFMSVIWVILLI